MKKIIVAVVLIIVPLVSGAQSWRGPDSGRAGTWDFGLQVTYLDSESVGSANGSELDIDSELGFGFVFGYNFTDHLAINFDLNWVRPDYQAVIVPDDGSEEISLQHRLSMFNGQVKGTYNLMKGAFSPYVEAGMGWTYIDSNVADSPPITGCWWDPWWGYVCSNFYNTYSDTNFSYSGGIGARWDIGDSMFVRASYNLLRLDLGSSASDPEFTFGRLEFGWRY